MRLPEPVSGPAAPFREPLVLGGVVGAGGRAQVLSAQVPDRRRWLIDTIVVSSASRTPSAVSVYDTRESFDRLIDGSDALGGGGVAAYVPARPLPAGSQLLIVWTGATVGDKVAARIEFREELTS